MTKLSFITFTRNSAKRIGGLLEHVKDIVDEIIVVDGYSDDETLDIVKSYDAKVYRRKPWGYAEPDRMFALKQASYSWILYLDDDERLCRKLKEDIKRLIEIGNNQEISAYSITRINLTRKKKPILGPFYPDRQVRIFKKDRVLYKGLIHEMPIVFGVNRSLPEEYYILHLDQEFWSKKFVHYVYIQKRQYYKHIHPSKLKKQLWNLMPFSIVPYYFYLLLAYSLRSKKPFNSLAIFYSIRLALYDGLLHTLMKIRTKREKIIAKRLSEKGLIQLLNL